MIALGGTSYAAIVITGANIKDGTVTSADIKNGTVTSGTSRTPPFNSETSPPPRRPASRAPPVLLAPPDRRGRRATPARRDRPDHEEQQAPQALPALPALPDLPAPLTPGPAGVITDGSVTTAKIADGAVTTDKVARYAITSDKLANDAFYWAETPVWSTYNDAATALTATSKKALTTTVGPGRYTVAAKAVGIRGAGAGIGWANCYLNGPGASDFSAGSTDTSPSASITLANQIVFPTTAATNEVNLTCTGTNMNLSWKKLTITKVDNLSNVGSANVP